MLQIDIVYRFITFALASNRSKPVNKQVGGSPDISIEHHW